MTMHRDLVLWIALFAGPAASLISFEANFALVPWTCLWQGKLTLYLVSLLALAVSIVSGLVAWREWNTLGRQIDPQGAGAVSRSRSMAVGGITLSALSCLIIVAQTIPEMVLEACQ